MQHTGKQLPARGGRSRHDEDPSSPSGSWMSHTFESIPKSPLRKQMSFVTFPEAHPPTALVQADNQPFPMFPSAEGEESITNVAWADVVPEQSHGSLFVSGLVPTTFGHGSPVPIYTIMPDSVIVHSNEEIFLPKDKTTGFYEPASPSDDSCASPPVTSKTAPQSVTSPTFSVSDNNGLSHSAAAAAASNSSKEAVGLRCKALFLDSSPLGLDSQEESTSNQPANVVIASPHSPFVTPLASSLSANRPSLSIQPLSLNQSQSDDCASSINIADHRRKLQVRRTTDVPNQVVSLGASTILSVSQNNTPPTTKEAPQATVPESAAPQPQKNAKPARPPITLREARPSDAEGIIALRDSLDMTNATSFVWELEDMRHRISNRSPLVIVATTIDYRDGSETHGLELVIGVAGVDVYGMEKEFPIRSIGSRLLGVPVNAEYTFPSNCCMCRGLLIHQDYQGAGLGSKLHRGRLKLLAGITPDAKVILSARGSTIEETLAVIVPYLDARESDATPEFTKDELFEFTFHTSKGIVHMVHGKDREGWKFVGVDVADGGPVWLTSRPLVEIVSTYDTKVNSAPPILHQISTTTSVPHSLPFERKNSTFYEDANNMESVPA
eukprot:GILI01002304.1.p1 GENE.GILI01002304.1~~GILI01002304.1.p1  ORF type:complete len:708 (-),score=108.10 GILI01002304.1:188-2020(-)